MRFASGNKKTHTKLGNDKKATIKFNGTSKLIYTKTKGFKWRLEQKTAFLCWTVMGKL